MKNALPPLLDRVGRKLRYFSLRQELNEYLGGMEEDNPLRGVTARVVGDASADPTEFFSHYDAFAFFIAQKLADDGRRRRMLDVGSPKMQIAMLSAAHAVTSLVLADCSDSLSAVRYLNCDISDPLPFANAAFDCFTSSSALQLVGLGRYGDRLNANCLPRFVRELDRVLTDDADLFVSMCLGPNLLAFNNGWFLDLQTIKRVFGRWVLIDALVDDWSSPKSRSLDGPAERRFCAPDDVGPIAFRDYRVVFCHFRRAPQQLP